MASETIYLNTKQLGLLTACDGTLCPISVTKSFVFEFNIQQLELCAIPERVVAIYRFYQDPLLLIDVREYR